MEQEEQPPPFDEVNFVPLLEPKTENFFSTRFPPHAGHAMLAPAAGTSFSNSRPQRPQRNSKIGTAQGPGAPYPAGGIVRASARNFSMPTSVNGWRTSCSRTAKGTVAMCAPMVAACATWSGERTLATMISLAKS